MKTAFITGASRGLGAAIHLAMRERGFNVIAPSHGQMDLRNEASIARFTNGMGAQIDVLINNAAVLTGDLSDSLRVNAMGPYFLTRCLWNNLSAGARIVNVSSIEGIMSGDLFGGREYSISKVALNAITRHMSSKLRDGRVCNACCPGWFRSRMGGEAAPRTPADAADTPVWLATEAPADLNGYFFQDRKIIPW